MCYLKSIIFFSLLLNWKNCGCSTFGNLESTTEWVEIVFNIIIITGGLILVTMLIGNIKVNS